LGVQRRSRIEPLRSVDAASGEKVKTLDSLAQVIAALKNSGKRVVQCHGVFDLVHLGHIRHLNLAKKEGDVLVVTITADRFVRKGPGRPVFNEHLRAETLAALAITDFVAIVSAPTAVECIQRLRPDVYVKGPDYKQKDKDITGGIYDEQKAIEDVGGTLVVTEDITFSSSNLINNHFEAYPPETIEYLKGMRSRHSIDAIVSGLESLESLKTLVIGDTIIDQYHYCLPMGKTSKEPIVANRYVSEEMFAGGALATANNMAAVCDSIDLLTVLGENESFEGFIRDRLNPGIEPLFFHRKDAQTIVKRRYVSQGAGRKLFEICHMEDGPIPAENEDEILDTLEKIIPKYDC